MFHKSNKNVCSLTRMVYNNIWNTDEATILYYSLFLESVCSHIIQHDDVFTLRIIIFDENNLVITMNSLQNEIHPEDEWYSQLTQYYIIC
jgi:hypothetical protein